jgi:ribosomal protein S18 acetylase RimI-like enzyme
VEREQAIQLQRHGLEAFYRVIARAGDDSRLHEFPGVIACSVPLCPTRSFPNSVVYERAEDLFAALDPLAAEYRHEGIQAWTVWVPEGETDATRLLADAGHRLDATPTAMVIELAGLAQPGTEDAELDWDDEATPAEMGRLNDVAYGWEDGGFAGAFTRNPELDLLRLFRARVDGELACVAATLDVGEDCLLAMVATDPRHRGAGLARRLCHAALAAAAERGLRTSSLQASPLGRPVYERLGYESFGAIEMWERR